MHEHVQSSWFTLDGKNKWTFYKSHLQRYWSLHIAKRWIVVQYYTIHIPIWPFVSMYMCFSKFIPERTWWLHVLKLFVHQLSKHETQSQLWISISTSGTVHRSTYQTIPLITELKANICDYVNRQQYESIIYLCFI